MVVSVSAAGIRISPTMGAARDAASDDRAWSRGTQPLTPTPMAPAVAPATPTSLHDVAARHRFHGSYVGRQGSGLFGIEDAASQ